MPRLIAVLLAGVLAVALGGSSCNSRNEHNEHNNAPAPPSLPSPMSDDIKIGDQGALPQQLQPQVQPTPLR